MHSVDRIENIYIFFYYLKFNVQGSVHRFLIYFQQDATLHTLFISGKLLYMFQTVWQVPDTVNTVVFAPDDVWRYYTRNM